MPKIRGETAWGERDRLMAGGSWGRGSAWWNRRELGERDRLVASGSWGRETAWVVGRRGILGKRRREIGEKEDLSRSKE